MRASIDVKKFIPKLKKVLAANPKGAVISDMQQKDQPIIYCNQTFFTMTGYTKDEVLGKNCRFLQQDDRQQEGLFLLRSAIKKQKPCKVTLRNYRKNGELFFNRLSISPIFNDEGVLTHYLGLQDDVTDIISIKEELKETEEENKVLLAEVHHRVKNNLSIMSSLLELEKNDKSQQDALEKSSLRIKSMALIHEKLYQKDGLAYIDISDFIKELASENILPTNTGTELEFNFDLAKAELNVNQAIPFSIIASELIHNISCHAYPNQTIGKVDIKLRTNGSPWLEFIIRDYGVGLPEQVRFDEPATLGFTLVKTLLMQINAEAEIVEDDAQGLGINVKIPMTELKGPSQNWRVGG